MEIPFTLSKDLLDHFVNKGIEPKDYMPAYEGESVGLDLYYAGKEDYQVTTDKKVMIPTGLKIALPKGYQGKVDDRGSICKTFYVRRAGIIDPGYTGEIFVNLLGVGTIKPGEKLPVQLIVSKVETSYSFVDHIEFEKLTDKAKRGEGALGSSD